MKIEKYFDKLEKAQDFLLANMVTRLLFLIKNC
jgi:hypothetical protein